MDFISNLIKRPISLVLNEPSTTMDKYQISASLPNTPSELENKENLKTATKENGEQHNNERPLSLSTSSCNDDNVTDFIDVPEEFLDEFKDILPPPPLSLQSSNALTQSLLDMEFTRSLSITPPPPPLTPSMKASQTIDELLLQINDNFQQAGFNDEVLAIGSPPKKSELSPLSSKAALNNSKLLNSSSSAPSTQLNTSKTSTKAAGPASLTVFENNSSLHKFPIDPELENCKIFDDATKDQMNNTGVNKSSNKFVGLTEFDEAKIPELPGDLNPNIEEQYNVTFEKCFVPTFKSNQGSADPDDECRVDKMHFLLPSEADATSDNETFIDCNDDRDPLASTFAEPDSLNVTTDADSYQSAFNNTLNCDLNNTMDNIVDITLEAESKPSSENNNLTQCQIVSMDEDDPMDVTMEILHNTSNNIQHVEKVLQHAENILQHIEDKKPLKAENSENTLLEKEKDFENKRLTKSTASNKDVEKEKEFSVHETQFNKNIELNINETQMECRNESLKLNKTSEENIVADINTNLPKDVMNLSANSSNSSAKSAVLSKTEKNLNLTLNLDTSISNQKSSAGAFNNTLSCVFNNTMHNIVDMTLEAEGKPSSKNINVTQYQIVSMDVDEPMDVTMEILNNTSNNIQQVEKVQQHVESILQHIEDKKPLKAENSENTLLEKETDFEIKRLTESTASNKDVEKERSMHETQLNKSIELHVNKTKMECPNEILKLNKTSEENIVTDTNTNLPKDVMNLSTNSNSSAKSAILNKTENNLNLTLNLDTSIYSQKSSAPSSPCFPMKTPPNTGFPRSPKAVIETHIKSPFMEKSDYLANLENEASATIGKSPLNSLNGNETEPTTGITSNLCKPFLEPCSTVDDTIKRRTFAVVDSAEELKENDAELRHKRQTFSIDQQEYERESIEKRRTFSVIANENVSNTLSKFPSMDKAENNRLTFNANDNTQNNEVITNEDNLSAPKTHENPRLTFNVPIEQKEPVSLAQQSRLNTSFEPMEVDENNVSHNNTISLSEVEEQSTQSSISTDIIEKSQSPLNCNGEQSSEFLISPVIQQNVQYSISSPQKSESNSVTNSYSSTMSSLQARNQSSTLSMTQPRSPSPPPLPDLADKTNETNPSPSPALDMVMNIKQELISPSTSFESTNSSFASQPLSSLIQKRPPIRDARARAGDTLSAKEQSNIKVKDEKDIFVGKSTPSPTEEVFTGVSATSTTLTNSSGFSGFDQASSSCSSADNYGEEQTKSQAADDEFSGNNNLILNPSDFDYLLTKGNNNAPVDRSSLLLKFDPLLGVPVPVNLGQPQLQQLQIPTITNNPYLSPTLEEDEHNESNRSFVIDTKPGASAKLLRERSQEIKQQLQLEQQIQQNRRQLTQEANKKNATMSVDVIKDMSLDNDCNKTFENSNSTQSDDKQINYKMDELEKKIKNEVLKTEDIEKKLKDAEQREEALIKRITEKDKTIAKMTGVIEAYEKAIAELIADKEQLTQNYEKQLAEVKNDRDSNYHHLTSLETTFSDLHVKYEKSKEMTCQLKESEEALLAEKRKNLENLHLQEQRYDKMKNHAMQQLEIANKKLESLTREHSIEITKLKALLKKEEIARSSINEQLAHKTKENAELVKICDELISGQGSNFSFEPFDPKKH